MTPCDKECREGACTTACLAREVAQNLSNELEVAIVAEVLAELHGNVWSGIFRPGSWERPWLAQAIGEDRLVELLAELEPTPDAPWRLRPRRPR